MPQSLAQQQYKKIAFLAPRADLSPESFRRHWREVHGPLVAAAPGYAAWRHRYVQNHVVGDGPFGGRFGYAGMAEFWLPGANEEAFAQSPTYRGHIEPDERNFIDMDRTVSMTVVERLVVPGGGPAKLVVLSRRRPGLDAAVFAEAAEDRVHACSARLADVVKGYALNLVLEGSSRLPGARPVDDIAIDAIHEVWFASPEALAAALEDPALHRALALSDPDLHALDGFVSFVAREIVFFEDGRPAAPPASEPARGS